MNQFLSSRFRAFIRYAAYLIIVCALGGTLVAENRAVLIAVPRVFEMPQIQTLEGPNNDVTSLRNSLIDNWGFRDDLIRTLAGVEATRTGILKSLDDLADETTSEDHVLVYFSGHGVSFHDPKTKGFGMGPDTGAIIPADLKPGPPEKILAGLVVGSRDLRPRFERLEHAGAEVLVLFDACYSGDSAKSPPRLVARSGDVFPQGKKAERAFDEAFAQTLASSTPGPAWPYERVVYISASLRHEVAWDIGAREARGERPTLDGLAHGAFTNGLLLALRGDGDRDRDGRINYSELKEFLVGSVIRDGQTPQLRPIGKPIVERPIFGRQAPNRFERSEAQQDLRVRLDPPDPELRVLLEGEDGIFLTDGEYDVEVRREPGRFRVFLAAGAELGAARLVDRADVAGLLGRRVRAQRISNLEFPAQDMRLEMLLQPEKGGVFYKGDQLSVGIRPGKAAWLLLVAIDSNGGIILVYPAVRLQAQRVSGRVMVHSTKLRVEAPFGTDMLEAFAFEDKPIGYDVWIDRSEPLNDAEAQRLYEMLRKDASRPGRARASRILYTVDR